MAENSSIEWTTHTFNPWIGCTKVAAGCTNCYAEAFAKRYNKAAWGPNGTRVKTSADYWRKPLKWNKEAALEHASRIGETERPRVFCASLADVFEDWTGDITDSHGERLWWCGAESKPATMNDVRRELFALIDATPYLDWLLLTKRPENIKRFWPAARNMPAGDPYRLDGYRPNVWLLTSVAEQADADRNVPHLLKCRDLVPVLGLSCEPLVGPVDLRMFVPQYGTIKMVSGEYAKQTGAKIGDTMVVRPQGGGIDWVIVGGESGHKARPMHRQWPRSICEQCTAAGVAFFFKQWGEWAPCKPGEPRSVCVDYHGKIGTEPQHHGYCPMNRAGKKAAGRLLDGREWNEFPSSGILSIL